MNPQPIDSLRIPINLRQPLINSATTIASSERLLHAGHFRDSHYKWYMLAARGYGRLFVFLFFWLIYVMALIQQHNTAEVNENTSVWRQMITQLKPDLTVKSSSSYWTFLDTKLLPGIFADTWEQTRDDGHKLHGSVALEYQYLVGGIALTSVRTERKVCYRDQFCREAVHLEEPFLELEGGNTTTSIPYNDFYGGYTVYIPTINKEQTMSLLQWYQNAGLFDASVNEMKANWISFNPNHRKTITLLEFGAHISSAGGWSISFSMNSIPYHLYPLRSKTPMEFVYRALLEACFILIALYLVRPYFLLWTSDEIIGVDKKVLGMPSDRSGTPFWQTQTIMWLLMALSLFLWVVIIYTSHTLPNFGEETLDTLYTGSSENIDSHRFQQDSLANFRTHVLPFYKTCWNFSQLFTAYSVINGLSMLVMTFRFFEYVSFQKRLSMITDTFAGISSELFHLLIVFVLVCFSFSLVCLFTFGMLDPSFTSAVNGFVSLLAMCFGLFRPASTQSPSSVGLYKYAPHAVNPSNESFVFPEIIFISFKLLVFMMLFKFIIAMIMDSYKDNHKKHRTKARSVLSDLLDLASYQSRRIGHALFNQPFVPMEHVAKALYFGESGGMAGDVTGPKNCLLYEKTDLFDLISRCPGIPTYRERDIDWVVRKYGLVRNQAILKERKRRKIENNIKKLPSSQIVRGKTQSVFQQFDTLRVGFLEIADLNDALEALGYHAIALDPKIMRRLIEQYDDNEDGVLEFCEFEAMLLDDVFQLQQSSISMVEEDGSPDDPRISHGSVYAKPGKTKINYG